MSYDLKQLFEVVGEVQEIDYRLDLSDYELFGGKPFADPVWVHGKIFNQAGVVTCSMKRILDWCSVVTAAWRSLNGRNTFRKRISLLPN